MKILGILTVSLFIYNVFKCLLKYLHSPCPKQDCREIVGPKQVISLLSSSLHYCRHEKGSVQMDVKDVWMVIDMTGKVNRAD